MQALTYQDKYTKPVLEEVEQEWPDETVEHAAERAIDFEERETNRRMLVNAHNYEETDALLQTADDLYN